MSQDKSFEQLTDILRKNPGEKLTLVYQWVKEDLITYQTFKGLIEWIDEDNKRQVALDCYD